MCKALEYTHLHEVTKKVLFNSRKEKLSKYLSKCGYSQLYYYISPSEPSIPDIEQEQDVDENGEVVEGASMGNQTPPLEGGDGAAASPPPDDAEAASTDGKSKKGAHESWA